MTSEKSKRIVVGISGASGVIYGVKMLRLLQDKDFEIHLIISEAGKVGYKRNNGGKRVILFLPLWHTLVDRELLEHIKVARE